jgi:hypothetical protein
MSSLSTLRLSATSRQRLAVLRTVSAATAGVPGGTRSLGRPPASGVSLAHQIPIHLFHLVENSWS